MEGTDRTTAWQNWRRIFWERITQELGGRESTGAARRFDDVWIVLDHLDNSGLIQFGIVEAPLGPPGATQSAPVVKSQWDQDDPLVVADKVLTKVREVRSDPIHSLIHQSQGKSPHT